MKMPTAVVVGEEDYATPVAMAEALHLGIAGSTLKVLKAGRHLTPLEDLRLRLHLLVCAWCKRYLKHIKFLRCVSQQRVSSRNTNAVALSPEARARIARSLDRVMRGWPGE